MTLSSKILKPLTAFNLLVVLPSTTVNGLILKTTTQLTIGDSDGPKPATIIDPKTNTTQPVDCSHEAPRNAACDPGKIPNDLPLQGTTPEELEAIRKKAIEKENQGEPVQGLDGEPLVEWKKKENVYLDGYPASIGGCKAFGTMGEAQKECAIVEDCGGVTQTSGSRFELRAGKEFKESLSGENSWKKVGDVPEGSLRPKPVEPSINWEKRSGKYLEGYPDSVGHNVWDTLEEAQEKCGNTSDCGGVTKQGHVEKYEMRRDREFKDSPTEEDSWLKH